MTTLNRVKVELSGTAVTGGGVSTFYTVGAGSVLANALQAFYNTIKGVFPTTLTINVQGAGEAFDSNDGSPEAPWTGGMTSGIVGGAAGVFAAGVGARVVWQTAGVTNNRRVRGSTYLVPLSAVYYGGDGTLDDTFRGGTLQNAINTFMGTMGTNLVIWTRPRENTSGVEHTVLSGSAPDKVSWLRSRRT